MSDFVAFLDANVLASPVTRTLCVVGLERSGGEVWWSAHAEAEADRHVRGTATRTSLVRAKLKRDLSATGRLPRGLKTKPSGDRQIIADAVAAGAQFIVTIDVDDFAIDDLRKLRLSAVNPDYFLAQRLTLDAYQAGVITLADGTSNPARTPADVHRMLGRRHPHLAARFPDAFDAVPADPDPDQPEVLYRGVICIRCGADLTTDEQLRLGLCAEHLG